MPEPLAICLEDLAPSPGAPRYLRCVAVVGRQPGLRLDGAGAVLWQEEGGAELWVTGDDQLALYRPPASPPVTVSRGGRTLAAPDVKPVILLDGDELQLGGRRLRVHVHGPAPAIGAPEPLVEEAQGGRLIRAAAAALALGAALGAADCNRVEVRTEPPAVAPAPRPDAKVARPDTAVAKKKPVEVREAPPVTVPPKKGPAE